MEADEAYIGKRETPIPSAQRNGRPYTKGGKSGGAQKRPIVALSSAAARFAHTTSRMSRPRAFVTFWCATRTARAACMPMKAALYPGVSNEFAQHETVNHAMKEYARGDVTTNSVEGFFGVFKRGFRGIYQHCGEQHLERYLNEFAFRYNRRQKLVVHDDERALIALQGAAGKRLTYWQINAAAHA